jgi:hypothetical protein
MKSTPHDHLNEPGKPEKGTFPGRPSDFCVENPRATVKVPTPHLHGNIMGLNISSYPRATVKVPAPHLPNPRPYYDDDEELGAFMVRAGVAEWVGGDLYGRPGRGIPLQKCVAHPLFPIVVEIPSSICYNKGSNIPCTADLETF